MPPHPPALPQLSKTRGYRIGYQDVGGIAGAKALAFLQAAALASGHQVIPCPTSDVVDAERPDFVIASTAQQPKVSSAPTYLHLGTRPWPAP